jgi:S-adenosylmethionine/arginine decarboxylase-like enzyme
MMFLTRRNKDMKGLGFNMILRQCKYDITTDGKALLKLLNQIVKKIDMVPLGVGEICPGDDKMPGTSVTRMIETSHMAIHGFTVNCTYIFGVVSCKEFDHSKLEKFLVKKFQPKDTELTIFPCDTIVEVRKNV